MASTKKSNVQPAATPFSTTDGAVPGQPNFNGQRPGDFTAKATSDAQRAAARPGRNFNAETGPQRTREAPEPAREERAFNTGELREGVDPGSIPSGGITTRADPTSGRGNFADAGPTPARAPFKNLR